MSGMARSVLHREAVLAKCDGFTDIQVWPVKSKLNPAQWLDNFTVDEQPYALCLLNSFVYYNETIIDSVMHSAFERVCSFVFQSGKDAIALLSDDRICFTYVTGENPNPTDSGFLFARKSRQALSVPEDRIMSPEQAMNEVISGSVNYIVFVDDFVGTGDQFVKTMDRLYRAQSPRSFSELSQIFKLRIFYMPAFCIESGLRRLKKDFPEVMYFPGKIILDKYDAFAKDSAVWPNDLRGGAACFLKGAAARAGCEERGYRELGFQVGFAHGVPDATLPIFWHATKEWKPLLRRR